MGIASGELGQNDGGKTMEGRMIRGRMMGA
ncbi:hypothetical protein Mal15_24720 [Stieleria maiorica]|uniref:Uncharacterized protein n=1 Tax=Stieleria maiorica TaxID=2795974 RepID=A0A5B9MEL5_9BACT|nr:hypothetical protein Mal15_24720 [Stieleria maiorica]